MESSLTYKVVMSGIRPNVSPAEAKARLTALFKASPEQIEKLLATTAYIVKRGIPLDAATKYKGAIDAAGGACMVVEESPLVPLDVDLPDCGTPVAKQSTQATAVPPSAPPLKSTPQTATVSPAAASVEIGNLPELWQKRFALIEKAGGVKLPHLRSLALREKTGILFNALAFAFGPFYYLAKKMWKKAITLSGLAMIVAVLLVMVLEMFGIRAGSPAIVGGVIFGIRANIDYYKKLVMNDNGWW